MRGRLSGSTLTVLVALASHLSVAVAKLAAGLISGSSSMLAEAAHSFAETSSQVLLLVGSGTGDAGRTTFTPSATAWHGSCGRSSCRC